MLFCRIENDEAVQWPVTEKELRFILSQYSLPSTLTSEVLAPLNYGVLADVDPTDLPIATKDEQLVIKALEKTESGLWKRVYGLEPVPESVHGRRLSNKWGEIRRARDKAMADFEWRLARHARQIRMGVEPTDDIAELDNYMQALADITNASDPFLVAMPVEPVSKERDMEVL